MNRFTIIFFIVLFGCENQKITFNHFDRCQDTLMIKTIKNRGVGLFSFGAMPLDFSDSIDSFSYQVVFPKELSEIKRALIRVDIRDQASNSIDILEARRDSEKVFVVDENGNKDLTDDSIRTFNKFTWDASEDLINCRFQRNDGQTWKEDSSWIKVGVLNERLYCSLLEHRVANFSIGNNDYKIGISHPRIFDFTFDVKPEIALFSENEKSLDKLELKDVLALGEYLKLDNSYYKIASISRYGESLTLIKEPNFNKKIGTQVGMIAPDFICLTISGDTLHRSNLINKPMVIANTCGCGGDQESTQAFYDIEKEFKDQLTVLRFDSKISKDLYGIQIDMEDEFNRDAYQKYRSEYCSRICFVIDTKNRIIDKFEVTDWERYLPKYL